MTLITIEKVQDVREAALDARAKAGIVADVSIHALGVIGVAMDGEGDYKTQREQENEFGVVRITENVRDALIEIVKRREGQDRHAILILDQVEKLHTVLRKFVDISKAQQHASEVIEIWADSLNEDLERLVDQMTSRTTALEV